MVDAADSQSYLRLSVRWRIDKSESFGGLKKLPKVKERWVLILGSHPLMIWPKEDA